MAFAFFIYPIITRNLGFGSVERASAEEGMEGFQEIRVTYIELVSWWGETDIRDVNGVGSIHPFTGIYNTEHRRLCSSHLR